MIAMTVLTIGVVGLISAFMGIQRASQVSKNKTVAVGLAQEQLQILGQLNYNQVLVTTPINYRTDYTPPIPYDTTYFPPTTILEGGVSYTRLTFVQVVNELSGKLNLLPPTTPDTGMRQVTSYVLWTEAGQKKILSLNTVLSNPFTITSNSNFVGSLTDAGTFAPIAGGRVTVAENQGWVSPSNALGQYGIATDPGNYTLVASAHGYFTQYLSATIAPTSTITQNFSMVAMASGTVTGTAWLNNNLVIAQVVVSTAQANVNNFQAQYVELYNPTASPIPIQSGVIGASPYIKLNFQSAPGCGDPSTCNNATWGIKLVYVSTAVPAYGYYVIANTTTFMVNGASITADAYYESDANSSTYCPTPPATWNTGSIPPVMAIMSQQGHGGELWLTNSTGTVIDQVGWTHNGNTPPMCAPNCIPFVATGFLPATQIVRTSSPNFVSSAWGPAYDTGISSIDFVYPPIIIGFPITPSNSSSPVTLPIAGRPAIGGVVTATDGLSSPTVIVSSGYPPVGSFVLMDVATSTLSAPWTVMIASGAYALQYSTVVIPATASNFNFPSSTTFLNQPMQLGFIAGHVTDALGNPIAAPVPITVSPGASGSNSLASTANGRYILSVSTGLINVTANPNGLNGNYVAVTSAPVSVLYPGQIIDGVNFILSQGGQVTGFVTRDGVNGLPGVTVSAINQNSGAAADTQVTDPQGRFTTVSIATGAYQIVPELNTLEVAQPAQPLVTVNNGTVWSATFTVTGALGTISGTVTSAGQPITSGALIVVTTNTLSGSPPAPPKLSKSLLTSSAIYLASSQEDGTYSVGVRQSTIPAQAYNIYGYYTSVSNTGAVTTKWKEITGVNILAGSTVTAQNFAW